MQKLPANPMLSETVSKYVQQYIIDAELRPGDQLPSETQMVEELGVGRGSVREAIKILQSLGIVEIQRGSGLYLREYNFDPLMAILVYGMRLNPAMFDELLQIRIWIESAIMDEVVRRITPQQITELEAVMDRWEANLKAGKSVRKDDEQFHSILYSTINNQTLNHLLSAFWVAFAELGLDTTAEAYTEDSSSFIHLRDHRAVVAAIKAGDAALARQRLLDNYAYGQQRRQPPPTPQEEK